MGIELIQPDDSLATTNSIIDRWADGTTLLSSEGYKTFLFEYFHDGSRWTLQIPATSMDDAQARVRKLPLAKPLGEVVARIPATAGPLVRCYCWLRNFFRQK